jgi:hypothetical protein
MANYSFVLFFFLLFCLCNTADGSPARNTGLGHLNFDFDEDEEDKRRKEPVSVKKPRSKETPMARAKSLRESIGVLDISAPNALKGNARYSLLFRVYYVFLVDRRVELFDEVMTCVYVWSGWV